MSTAARIAPFAPVHADALAALTAEAFGLPSAQATIGLGPADAKVWLAWPDGVAEDAPVGYCRMVVNRETREQGRACVDALFIRPEHRRAGHARRLLAAALGEAARNGLGGVWAYLPVSLPGRFVYLSGGRKIHDLRFLKHEAPAELGAPHLPAGYAVRAPLFPQDAPYLAELFNDIFVEAWNFRRHTPETMAAWFDAPDTRPENALLLECVNGASREGVGMAILAVDPNRLASGDKAAYVPDVGVVPAHRRKGLGRALVQISAQRALAYGAEALELIVSADDEEVRFFYQSLGFDEQGVVSVYEWPCDAQAEGAGAGP